jgi:hypothetical protein
LKITKCFDAKARWPSRYKINLNLERKLCLQFYKEFLNRSNIPYHRAGKYTTDSFEFLIRGFLDSNPGKGRGGRDLRLEDGYLLLYGLNLIKPLAYLLYNQLA